MALPVGHGLTGITIARQTDVDPRLAVVLANISDIDYFFGLFFANGNMLAFHRSPLTHSPPFSLFIMLLFWAFGHLRRKPYTQKQLVGIGLIVLSHWVLDYVMPPLPYQFDVQAGTNGLFDFLFAHIVGPEFLYNSVVDIGMYGTLYVVIWKFIFKKPLVPTLTKRTKKKKQRK